MIPHLFKSLPDGMNLFYAWFSAMHTRIDWAVYGEGTEKGYLDIAEEIRQELRSLEAVGNCYDENSELAFVNRMAAVKPVSLSEELYTMLSHCLEYYALTKGCFDVTVLSNNYYPGIMDNIHLDAQNRTLFYASPDVSINLSGFIKGYALEKIRVLLRDASIENTLVNMGNSSILALGNHPHGKGWKLLDDCILCNQCLTVSGNDTVDRRHIYSPSLGRFVEGKKQLSLITEDGMIGEILSTALFAATEAQREELLTLFQPYILNYSITE